MILNITQMQVIWEKRLVTFNKLDDEWKENFYIFSRNIKEEDLSKKILLLRYRLIEEETRQVV